jgi:hypothetical protein
LRHGGQVDEHHAMASRHALHFSAIGQPLFAGPRHLKLL